MPEKENIIKNRSYQFALDVIRLCMKAQKQKEYVLSRQLLKSATSIGANIEEATAGQTRKDFIAKMAIASKEARETYYWLRLFRDSKICDIDFSSAICESEALIKILTSIVKTSQKTS